MLYFNKSFNFVLYFSIVEHKAVTYVAHLVYFSTALRPILGKVILENGDETNLPVITTIFNYNDATNTPQ